MSCEKKAGIIAVIANFALAVFKLIVGILSGSKAVIGDSLYSFKDFLTSLVVFVGINISGKPPDENHPYGHGKIEFVAIFLVSLLIMTGTFFLFIHSVKDVWMIFKGIDTEPPKFIAFWAAIISMVANYRLSEYLHCIGEKTKSPSLLASAKHNHSDSVSSAFVAAAVLLTTLGLHFVDPLVAVIETVDLIFLCFFMIKDSLRSLLDSSVEGKIIKKIEATTLIVPGVKRVVSVYTRKIGQQIWVEMIVKIDHRLTIEEGHKIGKQIELTLKKRMNNIGGVYVSVEPLVL